MRACVHAYIRTYVHADLHLHSYRIYVDCYSWFWEWLNHHSRTQQELSLLTPAALCRRLRVFQSGKLQTRSGYIWIYLDDDLLHQLNGYVIKNNGDVTSQMMIIQHDIIQINYIHGYWIYWGWFSPPFGMIFPTDPTEVVPPFTRAPVVAYAWPGGRSGWLEVLGCFKYGFRLLLFMVFLWSWFLYCFYIWFLYGFIWLIWFVIWFL